MESRRPVKIVFAAADRCQGLKSEKSAARPERHPAAGTRGSYILSLTKQDLPIMEGGR
jgi:hypothetical protein